MNSRATLSQVFYGFSRMSFSQDSVVGLVTGLGMASVSWSLHPVPTCPPCKCSPALTCNGPAASVDEESWSWLYWSGAALGSFGLWLLWLLVDRETWSVPEPLEAQQFPRPQITAGETSLPQITLPESESLVTHREYPQQRPAPVRVNTPSSKPAGFDPRS